MMNHQLNKQLMVFFAAKLFLQTFGRESGN